MRLLLISLVIVLAGCASSGPDVPYPAFIQADELPDVFLASLPGVRAKQFAGNPRTRRSSNRIVLPANWSGSTGASPGKSLEIYVLFGQVRLGNDLRLSQGGYAWFPAGFSGVNLSSDYGAELLYFLDDANSASVIHTPVIYSSEVIEWQPLSARATDSGLMVKELRHDRGSGARTWLLQVTPGDTFSWQSRPGLLEGYLLSGRYRGTECVAGKPVSGVYTEGGYFLRPAGNVHGGPRTAALEPSVWLLRTTRAAAPVPAAGCRPAAAGD
ncbi:MAG: hypothetical protein U5K76_00725 [Woeseiaceae bacterium]|nr:hypothetical protein [Woeseiaceae bacterium]